MLISKDSIRREMLKKRLNFKHLDENTKILERLQKFLSQFENKKIGTYFPCDGEVDLRGLTGDLYLPKITDYEAKTMEFAKWGANLTLNRYKIPEPFDSEFAVPDIVITPLIAFDERCNRLGFGGGYYDRYFGTHKIWLKIGVAFDFQKTTGLIPVNPHDVPLDCVITQMRTYFFKKV